MTGQSEIAYSEEMISRSRKRLAYQRAVVAKLRFDSQPAYADLARGIEDVMAAKLASLLRQHAALVAGERPAWDRLAGGPAHSRRRGFATRLDRASTQSP